MNARWIVGVFVVCVAVSGSEAARKTAVYPKTRSGGQVDEYHGVKVADPHRWLEDLDGADTRSWVEAQNKVTFGFLEKLGGRAWLKKRLKTLWDFEKYEPPFKEAGRYFFNKNDGVQNQSVLYTMESLGAKPVVLLDPNRLSRDGTVALTGLSVSRDGKHLAYSVSQSGSDWQEWRVRTVPGGKDLKDQLKWVKFSGASWLPDGSGFYYSRYDKPADEKKKMSALNQFQKVYFHKLGTDQGEDRLVYERPDQKEWGFSAAVTDDGKYLVLSVWRGTDPKSALFYQDLSKPGSPVVELLKNFDAAYDFVDNDGSVLWITTDLDAPRKRLVAIDLNRPEKASWKELIPQSKETLTGVSVVGGRFIAQYLEDAHSRVKLFELDGKSAGDVQLPGIGSASGFGGKRAESETFFAFTSFSTPTEVWRLQPATGRVELWKRPKLEFDPTAYETRQVFYQSKDGTKIPMFLSGKKGFGTNGGPTLLYGYGGFNISITPAFSVQNLVWMEMGGVYAVANIRGGGEYGEDWHQGGILARKQNGFDDFIAAGQWLIDNKYTTREKLGIHGGSNGGLLVGACMTQRPDLFGCCLPAVGVLDMLRYHTFTIGWAWSSDYGTAAKAEEFKTLFAYSPVHNVKAGTHYPPTLITTGDHDDRVVPAHSYKFAAALQAAHAGKAPVLIRIDTKAGHGAGKPTSKRIEEAADRLAFLAHAVGLTVTGR